MGPLADELRHRDGTTKQVKVFFKTDQGKEMNGMVRAYVEHAVGEFEPPAIEHYAAAAAAARAATAAETHGATARRAVAAGGRDAVEVKARRGGYRGKGGQLSDLARPRAPEHARALHEAGGGCGAWGGGGDGSRAARRRAIRRRGRASGGGAPRVLVSSV